MDEHVFSFLDGAIRWSLSEFSEDGQTGWVLFYNENEAAKLGVRASRGVNVSLPIGVPEHWELVI